MAKHLTREQILELEANENVLYVKDNRIYYSNEFKYYFINAYMNGETPTQIFKNAGFDKKVLGEKRVERASAKWKKKYNEGKLLDLKDAMETDLTIREKNTMELADLKELHRVYKKKIESL